MAFTDAQTMLASVVTFFLSLLFSMALIVVGGTILDMVYNGFAQAGIFDLPGVWGNMGLYDLCNSLYYGFCILLPIICFVLMCVAVYNKYVLDREDEEQSYLMPPGGNI